MTPSEKAKKIISDIIYINIATVDHNGNPWNTPVYVAYDENYNFYWASWKENEHSKNIQSNPNVFITIYDSTVSEGTGEGVYIKAKAYELTNEQEVADALTLYYGRKGKTPRDIDEFMHEYPRRVYKAVPERFWMNAEGAADGNYVDVRNEINI